MNDVKFLGVVYEPTRIKLGMVSKCGEIEGAIDVKIEGLTPRTTLPKLTRAIKNYLKGRGANEAPKAIGIGLPGHVNWEKGIWLRSARMNIKQSIHISQEIEKTFGMPVYIDNDLNAATLAENYYGIGRISKDFLFVLLDEAVAAGIVSGGQLVQGAGNSAGELGYFFLSAGDIYLEKIVEQLTLDIIIAAQEGDLTALNTVQNVINVLGICLVNCVNLLNPEHIVLTGRISDNPWFVNQLKKYVYAHGNVNCVAALKDISPSVLQGDYSYVLGAAALCHLPRVEG